MIPDESKLKRKINKCLIAFGLISAPIFICCCAISVGIATLIGWDWGQDTAFHHAILFFYSPQLGAFILLVSSITSILLAIKKHKLSHWKIYLPLMGLFAYCVALFMTSHLILFGYAIPTKVDNPDNRNWSEGMVGRGLGRWPNGITCVLSDQVVALVDIWSFVTPDGRMPVLTWTSGQTPDSKLPGNPVSCSQLQPNWYLCYLAKPYQLILDGYGMCDQRPEP